MFQVKKGDTTDITADILDENGDPVQNGTATLTVDGKEYTSKKWIRAGAPVPIEGSSVKVVYNDDVPAKAEIFY